MIFAMNCEAWLARLYARLCAPLPSEAAIPATVRLKPDVNKTGNRESGPSARYRNALAKR